MAKRPSFRIDLGEIDPYFERCARVQELAVSKALTNLLNQFLRGEIEPLAPPRGVRKLRSISMESHSIKEAAEARAASLSLSLGRALRLLALAEVAKSATPGSGGGLVPSVSPGGYFAAVGTTDKGQLRVELRPTATEFEALKDKAKAAGHATVQDLMVAVLRAFLTQSPVLTPEVIASLEQANLSLVRIGANLNQLAKWANSGSMANSIDVSALEETMRALKQHTQEISAALNEARGRWVLRSTGLQNSEGVADGA